ncbi:GPW/gp25 family protein [Taibaiella koreensis]|uniref:GPW/gp25 family protein n=1 Tax=Taibaiella koreensis TaxID=1268548 RepID=UPI000E5A0595|nr:GPW/gp25 family protein [Taibaiella koreensis]
MYYKLPFDFGRIMEGQDAEPSYNMGENIAQHIQLLITTKLGENRYDPHYGNEIWNVEFENSITDSQWEEMFRQSVVNSIRAYEPRLIQPDASIHAELVEKVWPIKDYTEVKKKVTVIVRAVLADSGEKFSFKTELFLSPMSVD